LTAAPQSGQSFFDGWSFFTGADPTHGSFHVMQIFRLDFFLTLNGTGIVQYVDQNTGVSSS
jgi:hypothetical protein